MSKNIFDHLQGLDDEAKIEYLKTSSRTILQDQEYEVELPKDQIATIRTEVLQMEDEMDDKINEFKAIKQTHDAEIKATREERNRKRKMIRTGLQMMVGPLFLIPDMEQGIMQTVTNTGEIISTRPLRPEEKQFRIMDLHRKAENE